MTTCQVSLTYDFKRVSVLTEVGKEPCRSFDQRLLGRVVRLCTFTQRIRYTQGICNELGVAFNSSKRRKKAAKKYLNQSI